MKHKIICGVLIVSICASLAVAYINQRKSVQALNCEKQALSSQVIKLTDENQALSSQATKLAGENQALGAALQKANNQLSLFVDTTEVLGAAAPIYNIPLSEELQEYTYSMCEYYLIPEHYELVLAMMWQESNYTADAVSGTNDYGIMQINQVNHEWLSEQLGITDYLDARQSIEAGTYLISRLLHKYVDVHQALMAYNMGESGARNVWSAGNYTSSYSRGVVAKLEAILSDSYYAE